MFSNTDPAASHAPKTFTLREVVAKNMKDLLVCTAIFAGLSIFFIMQLNSLENGSEKSVSVWRPIAGLYNLLGYWPAVLFMPALGVVLAVAVARREMKGGIVKE